MQTLNSSGKQDCTRAPYVQQLAQNIVDGNISLKYLNECMNYEKIHNILLSIKGIGPKVASCVELFGLHRLQALPVDTWISKIISQKYDGYFPAHLYTGYEGLMQQYMFFYALDHKDEFKEEECQEEGGSENGIERR